MRNALNYLWAGAMALVLLCSSANAAPPTSAPNVGLRENTPAVFALVSARIVVRPGLVIEIGTIVVRDGVISEVGKEVNVPADAVAIDASGKTVYAGLIDAYSEYSGAKIDAKSGAPHWNPHVTPQLDVARQLTTDIDAHKKYRSQGITARLVAPSAGIIKGRSAVMTTGDESPTSALLRTSVAQHVRLTVSRGGGRERYPNSPMGAVALARQAIYDARWFATAHRAFVADPTLRQPENNDALTALASDMAGGRLFVVDAPNQRYLMRADRWAREFSLPIAIRGNGQEYRRIDSLRQSGRTVIVPVNFPKAPNVATPEAARNVTLQELMHWDLAPENPARLHTAGLPLVLTSHGLKDQGQFLAKTREAVQRGLPADAALAALTTRPAKLLGVDRHLGTLESGKIANLVVTDGELFTKKTEVLETWVRGRRYPVQTELPTDLRGNWIVELRKPRGKIARLHLKLSGEPDKLQARIGLRPNPSDDDEKTAKLTQTSFRNARFHGTFSVKPFGSDGIAQMSAVVTADGDALSWTGKIVWPGGDESVVKGQRGKEKEGQREETVADEKQKGAKETKIDRAASFEPNFPLGAYGPDRPPRAVDLVLVRGATIWTCGKVGILKDADLLFGGGKIIAIGRDLQAPKGARVIDAEGTHVTPGIIDCHSHMATDGGINESAQAVTAEVRIGDFIDAEDIAIYRQLAGGVTACSILHGSANPIGGQNQVIKLRWGLESEALKFADAPGGIKFALGENVKQSNWGDKYRTRYPQTRMGVVQIMRDTFQAARDYRRAHAEWRRTRAGLPPRIDLELEAVAEILEGKRWIHCHSYRQDEILALIRTLDDFGVTIGTFQHILEGYKVADAMARHGATGSAFSDWWAYKIEVYDAIPYNGALMHRAGVNVSFNSDDRELARHLNQEAAKAVKYGGLSPEEALKFVTLNPAIQLRIEKHVGSLEIGKHADLVIWSSNPLSNFARCEQTWIDGRKYFDRKEDADRRERAAEMHRALVQKILVTGAAMLKPGEESGDDKQLWPRHDIFCAHGHDHGDHGHGK
jgi:N-acetylglucosamine-6-phosphate deacetylase